MIRPTDSTVVVRVEEVFQAPASLDNFTGKEITVLLTKPHSVKVGQQLAFFTNGWLYGDGLAVVEVGRVEDPPDSKTFRRQVADAVQKAADQDLQKRIARAELVIVGVVSSTLIAPEQIRRDGVTEHDPEWVEAVIQVQSVEKGRLAQSTVSVFYPSSRDVMWYHVPKFRKGQEGIWILHRNEIPGFKIPGLTALDPLDFHSRDQLDRVRRLIKSIP
jgi:hypothetical protein